MYHGQQPLKRSFANIIGSAMNDNKVRRTLQFEAFQELEFREKVQTFHATVPLSPFGMNMLIPAILCDAATVARLRMDDHKTHTLTGSAYVGIWNE